MKERSLRTLILLLTTLELTSFSNILKAETYISNKGFYGTLSTGLGKHSDLDYDVFGLITGTFDYDFGFNYEAGLGYDFGNKFRSEVTYTRNNSATDGLTTKTNSFLFTTYRDFELDNKKWTPFVGLGIGTTNIDQTELCSSEGNDRCDNNAFTYGISTGFNYPLSTKTKLLAKITYLGFNDYKHIDDGVTFNVSGTETLSGRIGLQYKF